MTRVKELIEILTKAKEEYYNVGFSDLTDEEFDTLEDELKTLDSSNSYFTKVGIKSNGKKVKHDTPMLSMDKVKNPEEVKNWMNKLNLPGIFYVIEPKVDGLSAELAYKKGKLIQNQLIIKFLTLQSKDCFILQLTEMALSFYCQLEIILIKSGRYVEIYSINYGI